PGNSLIHPLKQTQTSPFLYPKNVVRRLSQDWTSAPCGIHPNHDTKALFLGLLHFFPSTQIGLQYHQTIPACPSSLRILSKMVVPYTTHPTTFDLDILFCARNLLRSCADVIAFAQKDDDKHLSTFCLQ